MSPRSTRRQLMAGSLGALAGLAGVSTSAQAAGAGQGHTLPAWVQDGKLLQDLLSAERTLIYACEAVLQSGKLHQAARELVLLHLAHDEIHVATLSSRLHALRLPAEHSKPTAPFPPKDVAALFTNVKHESDALQGLVQVENLAQYAYFNAAGSFSEVSLALLAAQILACEAQHWSLLETLLHKGNPTVAVPHPFVRGAMGITPPQATTS